MVKSDKIHLFILKKIFVKIFKNRLLKKIFSKHIYIRKKRRFFFFYRIFFNVSYLFKFRLINLILPTFFFFKYRFFKILRRLRRKKFFYFLFFRFSKLSLILFQFFKKYKRWTKYFLPTFLNLHIKRNFINYRGIFLNIGSRYFLPENISFAGKHNPYIILKSKKSFWRSISYCFSIFSYKFITDDLAPFLFSRIDRLNLYTNFYISIGWSVALRLVLRKKLFFQNISLFYFSAKSLLLSNFFFKGYAAITQIKNYFSMFLSEHNSIKKLVQKKKNIEKQ